MHSYVIVDQTPAAVVDGRHEKYGWIVSPEDEYPMSHVKFVCEFTVCSTVCEMEFKSDGPGSSQ